MSKIFVVFAIALLATGCVATRTVENYEATLDTWIGAPEAHLIGQWGPPDKFYSLDDDTKFLTYVWANTSTIAGTPPSYSTTFYGDTAYTTAYGGSDPITIRRRCETTFTITDGLVTDWSWQGNNCKL